MKFSSPHIEKKRSQSILHVLFVIALFMVGICPAQGAEKFEKVTIHLRWFHQFQFAGYYAAVKQGFYRDAGLDVSLVERGGKRNAIEAVLKEPGHYGVSNSGLLLYRLRGKPLVVLAAIFQHSPSVLFSRKSSGISTPQDLIGKRVMLPSKFQSSEILATFYNEGISLDLIDILPGSFSESDYLDKNIDAIVGYITDQPFFLEQNGVEYQVIKPRTYGIDFYGDCLFTSEHECQRFPERVIALRAASLKGWEYAMSAPDEIIQYILDTYGSRLSKEHLEFEAGAMRELLLPELVKIGHMNPGRWRHIADTLVKLKMTEPNYSLEGFLYDPYTPKDSILKKIVVFLFIVALAGSFGVGILFIFNKRLQKEVVQRKRVEERLLAANEEALEATRAKSQFLARMSHEIRTPMNGVIGMAGLLGNSELTSEQKEYVESILVSGNNLLRIINNILDFTKIESGKMEIDQELFSLESCIDDVIRMFRRQAIERGFKIYYLPGLGMPEFIIGDSTRIKEILVNLVNNAIKFGENSDVTIRSSYLAGDNQEVQIHFSVKDGGIGIPGDILPHLFQPFTQGDSSTTRRFGGTGLGLTICKQLAELMGGKIWVESTPGKGSEFFFTIQVRVPTQQKTDVYLEEMKPGSGNGIMGLANIEKKVIEPEQKGAYSILLAEDNLINQKLVKKILYKRGYNCDLVVNGFEVLKALERKEYNLILMDIQMPGMDGVEAAQNIIKRYGNRLRPKIIALTAHAVKGDREKYLAAGMDDYISKPIVIDEFIKKMDVWLAT